MFLNRQLDCFSERLILNQEFLQEVEVFVFPKAPLQVRTSDLSSLQNLRHSHPLIREIARVQLFARLIFTVQVRVLF